nr:hypothetical protein CFP56_16694 [Quercus suber]
MTRFGGRKKDKDKAMESKKRTAYIQQVRTTTAETRDGGWSESVVLASSSTSEVGCWHGAFVPACCAGRRPTNLQRRLSSACWEVVSRVETDTRKHQSFEHGMGACDGEARQQRQGSLPPTMHPQTLSDATLLAHSRRWSKSEKPTYSNTFTLTVPGLQSGTVGMYSTVLYWTYGAPLPEPSLLWDARPSRRRAQRTAPTASGNPPTSSRAISIACETKPALRTVCTVLYVQYVQYLRYCDTVALRVLLPQSVLDVTDGRSHPIVAIPSYSSLLCRCPSCTPALTANPPRPHAHLPALSATSRHLPQPPTLSRTRSGHCVACAPTPPSPRRPRTALV